MKKISVIVPIYNVESYLSQCLESILSQTLTEIEIICVDDGSTDQSGLILDEYAKKDNRIKVIHKSNEGYGGALNTGIAMATGEYIGIVESDDCIEKEMYQTLYDDAIKDDLDLVKSDAYYWFERLAYRRKIHYAHLEKYYNRVLFDIDRNVFFDFFMNIWTGIYKREFLEEYNIRFHETAGASYQDNGFWMQTMIYCRKAKWLDQAFYLYRQDNPEASVKSKDKVFAMTKEYEWLEQLLIKRGDTQFLPYCYYYKLIRHRGNFYRIADMYKLEFCEQIRKDYSKYKYFIKGNPYRDDWLHEVSIFPQEFCNKVLQKKQEIKTKLENSKEIILYGAGKRGDIVFRGLYNEGYDEKISCFAVSENPQNKLLAGKQILEIERALSSYPNAIVIVCVIRGSGMYRQMVENLKKFGINDFMDGTDIEDSFYIL